MRNCQNYSLDGLSQILNNIIKINKDIFYTNKTYTHQGGEMRLGLLSLLVLLCTSTNAATVAVIDSGTDMLHKDIAPYAWVNEAEIPRNDRDEDGNGYQDDVHGWNFAENNAKVIDYKYLGSLTFDIRRFFEIQTLMMIGQASDEDVKWLREKVQDQDFIKRLSVYGNFMHGTHVGSIAIRGNEDARLLAVKLIPTEVKLPFPADGAVESDKSGIGMFLLKQALGALAKQQMKLMEEIGHYINGHGADIANGSFGTGYPQSKMIVETLGKTFIKEITEEQIEEATLHFLSVLIKEGEHMVLAAEKTLFVFAAGNDGLNNDRYPTSPTNIQAQNVISVAATLKYGQLASFSNYGEKMVDVAAPGVGILASVPGNQYLRVSGTSQAAPFVANIASKIKDINSDLHPSQIKKIILGTVDQKDWLKGKVKTRGIVNKDRATRAGELSRTMTIEQAISTSMIEVDDIQDDSKELLARPTSGAEEFVLPLPSQFVLK